MTEEVWVIASQLKLGDRFYFDEAEVTVRSIRLSGNTAEVEVEELDGPVQFSATTPIQLVTESAPIQPATESAPIQISASEINPGDLIQIRNKQVLVTSIAFIGSQIRISTQTKELFFLSPKDVVLLIGEGPPLAFDEGASQLDDGDEPLTSGTRGFTPAPVMSQPTRAAIPTQPRFPASPANKYRSQSVFLATITTVVEVVLWALIGLTAIGSLIFAIQSQPSWVNAGESGTGSTESYPNLVPAIAAFAIGSAFYLFGIAIMRAIRLWAQRITDGH